MIFSLTSTSEITIIDQLAYVNRVTPRVRLLFEIPKRLPPFLHNAQYDKLKISYITNK